MRLVTIATPFLALFLASSATLDDTPRFAPAEKSTLTKTLTSEWSLSSQKAVMKIDGKEIPSDQNTLAMSIREARKVKVTDRYMKVADGRPLELDRTYDELVYTFDQSTTMPGASEPKAKKGVKTSALEGKTVRFSWNEKDSTYATSFAGADNDVELLSGLSEDLDVRRLLPSGEVKDGDTWTVDGKLFDKLLTPGGNLHFKDDASAKAAKASTDGDKSDDGSNELGDNVTGTATCKLVNVTKLRGHRIAMISIEADLKTHAEDKSNGDGGSEGVNTAEAALKLDGALLWDIDMNHVANFDLFGKIELVMRVDGVRESKGEKHRMQLEFDLAGDVRFEIVTDK